MKFREIGAQLLILSLLCGVTYAQGTTSRMLGTITDPTGAAIADATVKLTNQGTGTTFTTTSTSSGNYAFDSVQSGKYELTVEAKGFHKFVSKNNDVTIGQPATLNVKLEVGSITETVVVSAAVDAVQTSTSTNIGNVIEEKTIKDLPIVGTRGRNPLGLVDLQPGVIDTQAISGGAVVVFGARDRAWNITLDGIDNNESSSGGSDFAPLRTNPDSLEEFRVITSNFSAEYGRSSGAQVAMVSKAGTNQFHGSLFEFYRTPRFNANEWQNNYNSVGKKQFQQNIFGGDIGGPVFKNKTFFFFNVQGLTALSTSDITRTVYTASARQGIFRYVAGGRNGSAGSSTAAVDASGNPLPGLNIASYNIVANDPVHLGLDKKIQALMNASPLPNRFNVGDGLNTAGYSFTAPTQERQHDLNVRIDQIINEKNMVFGRVSWGQQNSNCDSANSGQSLFPGTPCQVNTKRDPKNLAFNWRWTPTPRLTNEIVFGLNQFGFIFDQPSADINGLSFLGYNSSISSGAPVDVPAADFGNSRTLKTWQVVDNIGYQRGSHLLKFGTNLRFGKEIDARGSIAGYNAATDVLFNADIVNSNFGIPSDINSGNDLPTLKSAINFLLGRVGEVRRGFAAPDGAKFVPGLLPYTDNLNEYDFYAQDTWKLRPNLTLDLGLRWEIKMAPSSPNAMLHPDQPLVGGAAPTNTAKWVPGSLYRNNYGNLGPSIGVAWDPFGTGKTSIRANYRIAYDRVNSFVLSSQVFNSMPGYVYGYDNASLGQTDTRLSTITPVQPPSGVDPTTFRQPAAYSSGSIAVVDPNLKFATTHQWGMSIQREVVRGGVFEADYIGRRAYHLLGAYDANQPNLFMPGLIDGFNTVAAGGQSTLINQLFSADNRIKTTASDMIRGSYSSDLSLSSYASILSSLARRVQNGVLMTQQSGAGWLIPFPQYAAGVTVIDSNDFSTYNGLVLQYQQRFRNGIQLQFSYTYSKALATRDFDPTFTVVSTGSSQGASSTPFDINNRKLNYGEPQYDHRHAFQAHSTIELPFGRGKALGNSAPAFVDRIIGGWEVAPIFTYYSGRPLTVYSGAYTFGSVVQSTVNCNGCSHSMGQVQQIGGYTWYLNPADKAQFGTPAPGQLGSTGKGYIFGPRFLDLDMSMLKRIRIREAMNLEIRADATNLTNTVSFGPPTLTYTSSTFGRIGGTVESGSRKFQLGMKFNF
jgi:hypothetical protein